MEIKLRSITLDDLHYICKWKCDPVIIKNALDENFVCDIEIQRKDIQKAISSKNSIYMMIECDQKPVGYIRADWIDEKKTHAWLRYALGEQRENRIMSIALLSFIDNLFDNNCQKIECEVYEYNIPSIKLLNNIGFKQVNTKKANHKFEGKYYDVFVYILLKDD